MPSSCNGVTEGNMSTLDSPATGDNPSNTGNTARNRQTRAAKRADQMQFVTSGLLLRVIRQVLSDTGFVVPVYRVKLSPSISAPGSSTLLLDRPPYVPLSSSSSRSQVRPSRFSPNIR